MTEKVEDNKKEEVDGTEVEDQPKTEDGGTDKKKDTDMLSKVGMKF